MCWRRTKWHEDLHQLAAGANALSCQLWHHKFCLTTSAALQHQASLDGCPKSHGLLWSMLWYYLLNLIYSLNQGDEDDE